VFFSELTLATLNAGQITTLVVTILWLIVLEGLLSADNALVLAVLVRHLPKNQRKRALRYGIIGAFGFRFIAILLSSYLMDFWYLEVLGGAYLVYLAAKHFLSLGDSGGEGGVKRKAKGFWATVVAVELADIAFSIDSILAAVAMGLALPPAIRDVPVFNLKIWVWVVFIGGILGIITMRYVAGYFIQLLERFPGLAHGAYGLVSWIGLQLIGGGLHRGEDDWIKWLPSGAHDIVGRIPLEMNSWVFWGGMAAIVVISLLANPKAKPGEHAGGAYEELKEFEEEGENGSGDEAGAAQSSPGNFSGDQPEGRGGDA
jgi:YkoY family integral membrane protein